MNKTYEQGYINGFAQSKKKIEELENNWNKLKEYCEEATFYYTVGNDEYKTEMVANRRTGLDILDKMQEIEKIDKINNLKEND